MAADPTWGVKVPEELKEEAERLMKESGLVGKEFVESLLQAYKLNILKETQRIVTPDIEELQSLTGRIVNIYANLGERINNLMLEKEINYKAEIESKESIIQLQNEKVRELEIELKNTVSNKESVENENLELLKKQVDIENVMQINKDLIDEYKEKNQNLEHAANNYQKCKQDYEKLKEENQETLYELKNTKKSYEDLQENMKSLQERHNSEINATSVRHKEDMQRLSEKLEIEKKTEILELKNEYQIKLSAAHEEFNSKIQSCFERIEKLQRNEKKFN